MIETDASHLCGGPQLPVWSSVWVARCESISPIPLANQFGSVAIPKDAAYREDNARRTDMASAAEIKQLEAKIKEDVKQINGAST